MSPNVLYLSICFENRVRSKLTRKYLNTYLKTHKLHEQHLISNWQMSKFAYVFNAYPLYTVVFRILEGQAKRVDRKYLRDRMKHWVTKGQRN